MEAGIQMSGDSFARTSTEAIVRSVLLVARLGEADRQGWWGTRSFGAAGRVVLGQRVPRTWRMAAAELDITSARNRHDEVIDRRNAVHLFSDNWPIRRWTSAWVAEQKTEAPPDSLFELLETISIEDLIDHLRGPKLNISIVGTAVRIGEVRSQDLESPDRLLGSVQLLSAAYAEMGSFTVPYLEVTG